MVTVEQIRVRNLRTLISEALGPANFSRATGLSESHVSQLAGRSPSKEIGKRLARRIEQTKGLPVGWLDTAHNEPPIRTRANVSIPAADAPGITYLKESVLIYAGSKKAGPPRVDLVPESEARPYAAEWFVRMRIKPENAHRFRVVGDSGMPLLHPDDVVLADFGDVTVVDGSLYALQYGNELRIKRLSRRIDGSLILSSDNPHYAPERLTVAGQKRIRILGRIREVIKTNGGL